MWKRLVFTAVFICIIGVSPSFAEAAIDSNGMPKWFIVTLHDIIQDSYIVEYQPCYETVKKITVISTFRRAAWMKWLPPIAVRSPSPL